MPSRAGHDVSNHEMPKSSAAWH